MEYYSSNPLGVPVLSIAKDAVTLILIVNGADSYELQQRIRKLKDCYLSKSLSSGKGDADFDDPIYQACYVFLYFPALCHGMFYGLQRCQQELGTLFERPPLTGLKVCSLGGGPGTDLFGVRMFLNSISYGDVPLRATVLDKHPNWKLAFNLLKLSSPCNLSADYLRMDTMGILRREHLNAIADADLITCIKFISAVKALPNSEQTLISLLTQAKPNTYFFYLDNSEGGNTQFTRSILQFAEFTELISFERGKYNPFQIPTTEYSSYLEDLPKWFDFNSQRNLRVTFMLWRKNSRAYNTNQQRSVSCLLNRQPRVPYMQYGKPTQNIQGRSGYSRPVYQQQTYPSSWSYRYQPRVQNTYYDYGRGYSRWGYGDRDYDYCEEGGWFF